MPWWRPLAGSLLALLALSAAASQSAGQPRIQKPRAAPPLTGPVTALPPAQFDNELAIGGEAVKAKAANNRLTIETRVNGRGPYRFIIDSGADSSVVGLDIARDLKLPLGTPVVVNNMTARNTVDRVKVDQLSFGSSVIRDLEVPALKEADLGSQGLLGIDALAQQRLMLDFERKLIRAEDARRPLHIPRDAIVITARRERGQLILTRVRAGGVRLDAVIDTGSEITVGNLALRDKLLGKGRTSFTTVEVTGVTGVSQKIELALVEELELGPVLLRNVPIAFADLLPFRVFGLSAEPALLLGTDLLANFRTVSLDFRARKVRFQLRRCRSDNVAIEGPAPTTVVNLSWTGDPAACAA